MALFEGLFLWHVSRRLIALRRGQFVCYGVCWQVEKWEENDCTEEQQQAFQEALGARSLVVGRAVFRSCRPNGWLFNWPKVQQKLQPLPQRRDELDMEYDALAL